MLKMASDVIVIVLRRLNVHGAIMARLFFDLQTGPALESAGPGLKHFCGVPLTGVCIIV